MSQDMLRENSGELTRWQKLFLKGMRAGTLLVSASVLVSCAGNYHNGTQVDSTLLSGTGTTTNSTFTLASPTPSASGTVTGIPAYSFRAGTTGYNAVTLTVSAGKVLKLEFAPGIQDQTVAGTGYAPEYSLMGVYITVNGSTQQTPIMENGYYGAAQTSGVMDFSSALPTCGSGADSTCRQNVTITIDHPNYDFDCLLYSINCPWEHVKPTHPWHGTLTVQTDDTNSL